MVAIGEGSHLTPTVFPRPAETFSRSLCWDSGLAARRIALTSATSVIRTAWIANRQPGRAGDDSKKYKRIQPVQEGQARDKPQTVHSCRTARITTDVATAPKVGAGTWH